MCTSLFFAASIQQNACRPKLNLLPAMHVLHARFVIKVAGQAVGCSSIQQKLVMAKARCNSKRSHNFSIENILQRHAVQRPVQTGYGESSTPPGSPHLPSLLSFLPPSFLANSQFISSRASPLQSGSGLHHYQLLLAASPSLVQYCPLRPPAYLPPTGPLATAHHSPSTTSDDEECEDSSLAESLIIDKEDKSKMDDFKKKKRTAFTTAQLQELERRFQEQKYLTKMDRVQLAQQLKLTEKHVKTWYQNRRTKWKRSATEMEWSLEREKSAAIMYQQFVDEKTL